MDPAPPSDLPNREKPANWPRELITPELVHEWVTAEESFDRVLCEGFDSLRADEGTLWIVNTATEELVPAYSSSRRASEFVLRHRQPLSNGIVSMVCVSEQPFAEIAVYRNAQQNPALDRLLGLRTWAMAAVPLYVDQTCLGVLSAVQLMPVDREDDSRPGFDTDALAAMQSLAARAGNLVQRKLSQETSPEAT